MRHLTNILKWFAILLLIFAAGFVIYLQVKIQQPFKTGAGAKLFVISKGETSKQIGQDLKDQGFISSPLFFELNARLKNLGGKIQAGVYSLSPSMSVSDITKIFIDGKVVNNTVKLTILEGWTAKDIAKALENGQILSANAFLNLTTAAAKNDFASLIASFAFLADKPKSASLEGYLFPDTYFFLKDSKPLDVAKKILQNFDRKTADVQTQAHSQGKSLYAIVTMASIIEREVGRNVDKLTPADFQKLQQERRLVASVFYNRLKIGMALESDATVSYVTGSKSNRATLEETKINSPYNTYKYRGLPPGPISNPSLDSIEAALSPAQSDYLYFVTAPDGTAYFAKTLQEHNQNRQKYIQ
jgi:UPF0755 protein